MADRVPKTIDAIAPEAMREMFRFEKSRVLLTAFELGLFTELADEWRDSAQVAGALGTDARATDRLMNALCAFGILIKEGNRFRNSEPAARLLVKGKPTYMAGLMHIVDLWTSWSKLTEAVRRGTWVPKTPLDHRETKEVEAFISAMHANGQARAPAVIGMLDLKGVSTVLDIGGGSGAYAMAFARANPGLRATVFDLPNVLPLTRGYLREAGLENRIDTVAGDYFTDNLGKGFDLAFLSMIIHSNSPAQNRALFQSVHDALNASGRIVIHEMVVDENRIWPPYAVVFALNMLVNTESGDSFTQAEIYSWMKDAGFREFQRLDTPFETAILIGLKGAV
jgi:predicted O-methyltransferase YrrM